MGFIELGKRMRLLVNDKFAEIMHEVLNELAPEIVKINKEQLEKGEKADETLMPYYSPNTIRVRNLDGNPVKGERIALIDSGDFWNGFWAMAYQNKLEMISSDTKTNMLIADYGESIFGLNKKGFERLGDLAYPLLKQKVGQFLQQ